ncbi:hypothetical protein VXS06_14790 [Photobacterium toruni]|uniref:Uncharacterized protein n=1 Tax=Photobacterium toruni TaxID=1935446 RepID=A0ABU6L8X9_9GAMM|nr:hypothetical protein [Photobacterium toruni]
MIDTDISKLHFTTQAKKILISLLQDPSKYISYSPAKLWGGYGRDPLIGAWIVKDTHFGIEKIEKIHGRSILSLVESKIITLADSENSDNKIKFYKLSDFAVENIRTIRQRVMFDDRSVLRKKLNELAAMYQLEVIYCSSRGYFEFKRLDGVPIKQPYLISANSKGEPIYKFCDLSWPEWDELLYSASQQIYKITH